MSLLIAATWFGLSRLVEATIHQPLLVAGLGWLGWINGMLAAFNLVPAFPLDGGRVLRAWRWRRHGDKVRATVAAANAGRAFAFVLIALGVLEFAVGASLVGLWLIFLGWFLLSASTAELPRSFVTSHVAPIPVRAAMTPHPIVVPADITVGQLVDRWMDPLGPELLQQAQADGEGTAVATRRSRSAISCRGSACRAPGRPTRPPPG